MIKNKYGESLIGVIIGVFILTFIILGVSSLLINSVTVVGSYENKRDINMIRNNTINTVKKIDTSSVQEGEIFYLYKDSTLKTFEIKTGTGNYTYKYIDRLGNKVDNVNTFNGNIYSRVLWLEREDTYIGKERQIIKASVRKLVKK